MTDATRPRPSTDLGRCVGSWCRVMLAALVESAARRIAWSAGRWFWARAFGLCLILSTPGLLDTLQELVECTTGVECCNAGACDERGSGTCTHACTHCGCCAHPKALLGAVQPVALAPSESGHASIMGAERSLASGFRSPPFRPPLG